MSTASSASCTSSSPCQESAATRFGLSTQGSVMCAGSADDEGEVGAGGPAPAQVQAAV